ncbi:universal stress protein A-like protein [Tanacetum coccineum]
MATSTRVESPKTRIMMGVNESSMKGYPHASISSKSAFEWTLNKIIQSNTSAFKLLFLHVQVPDEDGWPGGKRVCGYHSKLSEVSSSIPARGDPTVRIPAFQSGGQGFESNREKINPLVATEVHLRRLRAIQKGNCSGISQLAMLNRKPRLYAVSAV